MNTITHGFELLEERAIGEINSRVQFLRHRKSGAQLLNMINDDENKVFGIAFATPSWDSTGIAHVLEHSVLCGSRKYPLKEPFVELIKGSLNTFINAMTWPDHTVYPVASQNAKDLYNLVDVYLDAVLYPNLTPWTLMQEGWHYELEDKSQPLRFKGVVFNEMKGNYSSPESLLSEYVRQSLFPDTLYAFDSGGDPACMPDLDYRRFREFHARYYHPSNARIVFSGDDDPIERLRYLDTWLSAFDARDFTPEIPLQPRWTAPQHITREYDPGGDAADEEAFVSVNWLLAEYDDPERALTLEILAHLLTGTPASPLYKALIDSGLGEDVTGGYIDGDTRESFYQIGLKGVAPDAADQVQSLILETIGRIAETGFDADLVQASLNTTEFNLREANFGGAPRGIVYMIQSLQSWLHGRDPFAPLAFEGPLQGLKMRLTAGERVFDALLRSFLIDNPHRSTVVLLPNAQWLTERDAAERRRLDSTRSTMSDAELESLAADTRTLKTMQVAPDSPEALAAIPALRLSDLDTRNKTVPIAVAERRGATVVSHDLATRGIVYLDVGFDLQVLAAEDLPYAGILGTALLEMGTARQDFVTISRRIGRNTGGVDAALIHAVTQQTRTTVARFLLRGKSLPLQFGELLAILRDVLSTARFGDRERFRQILLEEKADLESSLVPDGRRFVDLRLRAGFNAADWVAEQTGGIAYLQFLRRLVERVERDWPRVLADLQRVRDRLVTRQGLIANITADAVTLSGLRPALDGFIDALPSVPCGIAGDWPAAGDPVNEGFSLPTQVNFVGKGADLYAAGHRLHGSWLVVQNWLNTTYLWERVRVQGGAYGGFCRFDPLGGAWTFLSYRDPNLTATLDIYDQAAAYLQSHLPDRAEVERTIIGVIGGFDNYLLPDAKGYASLTRFLSEVDEDSRQRLRDEVLATAPQDFARFAEVLDRLSEQGHVAVLGSPQALASANSSLKAGARLRVTKIL